MNPRRGPISRRAEDRVTVPSLAHYFGPYPTAIASFLPWFLYRAALNCVTVNFRSFPKEICILFPLFHLHGSFNDPPPNSIVPSMNQRTAVRNCKITLNTVVTLNDHSILSVPRLPQKILRHIFQFLSTRMKKIWKTQLFSIQLFLALYFGA